MGKLEQMQCSLQGGGGEQRRSRSFTNPPVAYGGKRCEGLTEMFAEF